MSGSSSSGWPPAHRPGTRPPLFYVLTYALMALGGFAMVIWLGRAGMEADRLEDFKGVNERNPWFAFMMLILMLSMAGVPPFVGFLGKVVRVAGGGRRRHDVARGGGRCCSPSSVCSTTCASSA